MPFTFSRKSLVGRLMLAFCLLGFLLLLLISLGSFSLYWVKQADSYLYDEALPASQVARELVQSSNALAGNAQALGDVKEEAQRQFIGRLLSINSNHLLDAIARLKALKLESYYRLEWSAAEIIYDLSALGKQVGKRLEVASKLESQGEALVRSARFSTELLEAELAVVDSAIMAKLSLAYPQLAGEKKTAELLDAVIEQDIDIQERLNRALQLIHDIALVGQLLQAPEQEGAMLTLLAAMSQFSSVSTLAANVTSQPSLTVQDPNSSSLSNAAPSINLMPLELLKGLIRDPTRARELAAELVILRQVSSGLAAQQKYIYLHKGQDKQLYQLSEKLNGLNRSLDTSMAEQLEKAELARGNYLRQLFWVKVGLLSTGVLMFLVILFVMYRVIYKGIAIKLNDATQALARLSLGDTNVTINAQGDDELTAMAGALEAFKQKTAHNQKLQAELRDTAAELTEHKAALEITILARTQELAVANKRLDAEARGHAQARTMAEQASQAKSLFLATMSHEIRTPLNGLLGTLTLLSHSDLPVAQKQMLALSQYSGTLLQTVLNDILDFSRLEQGKLANEPRPVAINDLLDEVVAIMLAGAGLAGLRLVLDRPVLPSWVMLDGPKLRQVLFNLIGNGIKFTPEGEVRLKVEFDNDYLYFVVSDTGVGITSEAQQHLFKAYGPQFNQGRSRGTGLGLAISKELVDLMSPSSQDSDADDKRRSLWVSSEPSAGSRFGFCLPLIRCQQVVGPQAGQAKEVAKKKVLVIEDNKVNAMVAQGFLAHLGHESVLADSCAQAYSRYDADNAHEFDAIMLDIQLGDGSGFELLNYLSAVNFKAKHQLPIAAFTAQIQADDLYYYQQAGFDTVLGKPLDMQSLAAWIGVASAKVSGQAEQGGTAQQSERALVPASAGLVSQPGLEHDGGKQDESHDENKHDGSKHDENSESKQMTNPNLVDINLIDQDITYLGKVAVVDMLKLLRTSSEAQLSQLAALPSDPGKLLHALKGSSASMGLTELSALCHTLEKQTYGGDEHQALVHMLELSLDALQAHLDAC